MVSRSAELEQITPKYLWDELHVKNGDSKQASHLSMEVLANMNTHGFLAPGRAERHGEMSRILEQTSASVAKRAPDWESAKPYLLRAGHAVANHYPVGETPGEAILRGNYWEPVYGDESAQRICAIDMADLYEILARLSNTNELQKLAWVLRYAVGRGGDETLVMGQTERFELIRLISKHGIEYPKVRDAYLKFLRAYGLESATEDLDQIATVSSIALGKAFQHADFKTVRIALGTLKNIVMKDQSYWKFVAKQIAENFSPNTKQAILSGKLDSWASAAQSSRDLMKLIEELEQYVFFGLGNEKYASLKKSA